VEQNWALLRLGVKVAPHWAQGLGLTQQGIATRLGCSRATVRRLLC
jgi:DNA-binding transcriptional regulator LsrR (DeoR family)